MGDLIEREAAVAELGRLLNEVVDSAAHKVGAGFADVAIEDMRATFLMGKISAMIRALPAATRYAELERAARDADEGIASLTNWLHNVTPSPGLEDLVRGCSAANMTPHDAYEHGRILRRFDISAALRPHIEILARISDALANLDKEQPE